MDVRPFTQCSGPEVDLDQDLDLSGGIDYISIDLEI